MARKPLAVALVLLAALLAVLVGAGAARAQTPGQLQTADDGIRFGQRQPATGARMMGRAGAGIAGVADYGALFTNPAGLGLFETSQGAGTLGLLDVTDEARFDPAPDAALTSQSQGTEDVTGGFGLVYKFPTARGSLVLAGGFNQVNTFRRELAFAGQNDASTVTTTFLPFGGIGEEYDFNDAGELEFFRDLSFDAFSGGAIEYFDEQDGDGVFFLEAAAPGTTLQQDARIIEEGRLTEVNLGGSVAIAPRVFLGLSVNVVSGTYRYDRLFEERDVNNENLPADYSAFPAEGAQELRGFDRLEFGETTESDLTGGNLRLGLSAELTPSVRVGAAIETPTFYRVDQTFSTDITTFFDEALLENGTVEEGGFLTFNDTQGQFERANRNYDLRTPWRLGGGLSINTLALTDGVADLTLAADAEVVDWTQTTFDNGANRFGERVLLDEENMVIENDYRTVVNTRLGAEYRQGDVFVRAGFAYQPDPLDVEINLPGGETTDRSKTFYSLGLGYRFGAFQIDAAFEQARFDNQRLAYSDPAIENPPIVDEEVVQSRFVGGVSYSF